MNKRARRKGHIAKRAVALLLSLAMVFSVIYLNDRKTKSEADPSVTMFENDTDYEETVFLNGKDFKTAGQTYTLNNPMKNTRFKLPEVSSDSADVSYGWYEAGDVPTRDTTEPWTVTGGTAVTHLTEVSGAGYTENAVLCEIKKGQQGQPASGSDPEVQQVDAEVTELSSITLNQHGICLGPIATIDTTNKKVTLAGDSTYAVGTASTDPLVLNYVSISYGYYKNDSSSTGSDGITEWGALDTIETKINASGKENDGWYDVCQKTVLNKNGVSETKDMSNAHFERDFYLDITKASIKSGSVDGTSYYPSEKKLSITGAAPMTDVVVSFELSDSNTTVTAKKGTETPITGTATSVTIPGAKSNDGLQNVTYTIEVSANGKHTETFTADISYLSTQPEVDNLAVEGKNGRIPAQDSQGRYLLNADDKTDSNVKAHIKTTEGSKFTAKLLNGTTQVGDVQTVNQKEATVKFPVVLSAAGEYEYKVQADCDGVDKTSDDSVKLLFDNSKPIIEKVEVSQTFSSGEKKQTESGGTFAEKLTGTKPITFDVTVTDATNTDESGAAKVTASLWGDYTATQNGNVFTFTVPANQGFKGQTSGLDCTIVAEDAAGNVSDTKTVKLFFAKDEITITRNITDDSAQSTGSTGNSAFNIDYTIKSDVQLKSATFTMTQKTGSVVTPVTVDVPLTNETLGSDDLYEYTYSYPVSVAASTTLDSIKMEAVNKNDVEATPNELQIIKIDMTDPEVGFTFDPDDQARIDNKKWFTDLAIKVTYKDSDPSGGFYEDDPKGVKTFPMDARIGVTVEQNTYDKSKNEGSAILNVNHSTNEAGTEIYFELEDSAGNRYKSFPKQTVYVDHDSPSIDKLYVNGKSDTSKPFTGNPTLSFEANDNIKVVDAKAVITKPDKTTVDITSFLNAGFSLDKTALGTLIGAAPADGDYTLAVSIADHPVESVASPSGYGSVVSKSITFRVDNTRPVATIKYEDPSIIKNGKYTNSKKVVVLLHIEDANLGNVEADPSIVKVTDEAKSGLSVTWNQSGNKADARIEITDVNVLHKLTLEVRDEAKLTNTAVLGPFIIDLNAPTISTTLQYKGYGPKDYSYLSKAARVRVEATDDEGNMDDKHGLSYTVNMVPSDGSKDTTYTYDNQPTTLTKIYSEDADYVITFVATDLAGNKATRKIKFTVDCTEPLSDIQLSTPTDAAKFDRYHATYNNEDTGLKYDYAQYFNDDVEMSLTAQDYNLTRILVTDSASDKPIVDLKNFDSDKIDEFLESYLAKTEGNHTIAITAWDKAGNSSTVQTVEFVIDRTKPTLTTTLNASSFTSGGETRYLNSNATVAVMVSDSYKDTEDLTRILKITPPGGGGSSTETKVAEGSQDFSTEADYDIAFVAVDKAGNESAKHSATFRVDKTAPELRISGAAEGGTTTEAINISYSVREAFYSDMPKAVVRVYKKVDGSGETLLRTVDFKASGADSSMSEHFTEDGQYRFEFEAEDKAGNKANTTYNFILDATAPTIVLSGVKNYDKTKTDVEMGILVTENFYTSNKLTIEGTRLDIDGKKNPVKIDPFNANSSREVNIAQVFKEDGIYDINITSKDKAGNEAKQSVHFTIDKTAPEIGDLSKYDGKKLNKFVWDIDEEDLVRDLTVCDVTIYLDGTVYDGMANLTDGSHVLRVTATDELGNTSSKEVTFQLDQIAPTIIISGIEDQQRIEEPVSISVSLQIDEDTLDSVSLNGKEMDLSGNTSSFKVEESGDYSLVVKAHDEAGNESKIEWTFVYGSKFNWWWIVIGCGAAVLLALIILIIRKKSWSQK